MDVTSIQRPATVTHLRPAATPAATFNGTAQDTSSTTTNLSAQRTRIEHYEDVTHLAPKGDGRELMKRLYTPAQRQEMANRLIEVENISQKSRLDRIKYLEYYIEHLQQRNMGKTAALSVQEANQNEQVISEYRAQLYRAQSYDIESDTTRKSVLKFAAMILDTTFESIEQMV